MYDKEAVKKVLMERDGNTEEEAQDRIDNAQEDINEVLDKEQASVLDLEYMIEDHFGLEPDYLMGFMEV